MSTFDSTRRSPPDPPQRAARSAEIWDALLAEDEAEVDVALIAAYAEGRLDERQRQSVKALLARSPRAMQLLSSVREDLQLGSPTTVRLGRGATGAPAAGWRRAAAPLLAAAGLLLAVGTAHHFSRIAGERQRALAALEARLDEQQRTIGSLESALATLETQQADRARALAAQQRDRLYALAVERPPFLTSAGAPGLAKLALSYRTEASRSAQDPPAEVRAAREAEAQRALSQANDDFSGLPDSPANLLDRAALHLAAGRFDDAERLIAQAEADTGESAASLNLRAAVAMTRAMDAVPAVADRLRGEARRLLERAIELDPGFPLAWFNLALLEEDLGNQQAAQSLWREYLARETDEALKALVRATRDV